MGEGGGVEAAPLGEGKGSQAGEEHSLRGIAGGGPDTLLGDGEGLEAAGVEEVGDGALEVGVELQGGEGDAGVLGDSALAAAEGFAAGGKEGGFAHSQDGLEGEEEGGGVVEAGSADLEVGDGEGFHQGAERAGGEADGAELLEEG